MRRLTSLLQPFKGCPGPQLCMSRSSRDIPGPDPFPEEHDDSITPLMSDYRYATQSDAYAAEHDLHQRNTVENGRKVSLSHNYSSDASPNDADDLLKAMGYKAELVRSRSTFQVAFMSFVLASVPYGLATTLFYPIACAGPVGIIWGWLGVSLIIICVAASLGEITSVYPTSGGVYYQTFMLAPPSYRKIASWICGWAFVVGNITITLAVNFATALFLGACINVFETDGVGIFAGSNWQIYLIFFAITLLCNIVSSLGNRWLPWLDVRLLTLSIPEVLLTVTRLLPFSGPLLVCSPSSCASLPLQRTDAITRNTSSPNSTTLIPDGCLDGLSVSDCFMPPMRLPRLA
jgi:hypothetical protein